MPIRPSAAAWSAILVATLVAWLVYRPGLGGPFIFDDFANLPSLGETGPVDNWPALARYLTSGHADPTGRPLALASFLLDAHDWPADPWQFKRTNVVLHLANGLLLFTVLARLGRALDWSERRAAVAAVTGASAWMLHPFFVSTTLYVVQREAMLPATFTLISLMGYLTSRQAAAVGAIRPAALGLLSTVGVCTLLAGLTKANGILIPLLVLTVHFVMPAKPYLRRFDRLCAWTLVPPGLIVLLALCWTAIGALGDPPIPLRGWSVMQRLLTEPAILWDYMAQLWLVQPTSSSLLHDDVAVATRWNSPWYTMLAVATWGAVTVAACIGRRRAPALAAGLLFFLAGHLIESTAIPLELYFEHRNYLPSLLLFWYPGALLGAVRSNARIAAMLAAVCTLLGSLTYTLSRTWGEPIIQAAEWAHTHPDSPRAQAYAAQMYSSAGQTSLARATIERAARRFDAEPQVALNLIDIHCQSGSVTNADVRYAELSFLKAQREPGPLLLSWMTRAAERVRNGSCQGLTRDDLERILVNATNNPRIFSVAGRRQDIDHLYGMLALKWNQPDQALTWFDTALEALPTPQAALRQAAELGKAGYPAEGLRHLDFYATLPQETPAGWRDGMPWLHQLVLSRQDYWSNEAAHLRQTLRTAAERLPHQS